MSETQHRMKLVCTKDEVDEYRCPVCGRAVSINWELKNRVVLLPGDDTVMHSLGKGGLEISPPKVKQKDYLEPFKEFLDG